MAFLAALFRGDRRRGALGGGEGDFDLSRSGLDADDEKRSFCEQLDENMSFIDPDENMSFVESCAKLSENFFIQLRLTEGDRFNESFSYL